MTWRSVIGRFQFQIHIHNQMQMHMQFHIQVLLRILNQAVMMIQQLIQISDLRGENDEYAELDAVKSGEQKIRDENVGLKRMVEDLKIQLAAEQSINIVVQSKMATVDDGAKADQMPKNVAEDVTVQDAEEEKDKDEANPDQGIVDPRSAYGSSHRAVPVLEAKKI